MREQPYPSPPPRITHTHVYFLVDTDIHFIHLCCHSYFEGKAVLLRVPSVCFSALSVTSNVAWVIRLDALMHLAHNFLDPSLHCSVKASFITVATCCWYSGMVPDCSDVCVCMQKGWRIHKLLIKTNSSHQRSLFWTTEAVNLHLIWLALASGFQCSHLQLLERANQLDIEDIFKYIPRRYIWIS